MKTTVRAGFTLIEMLVVMGIIAVLAAALMAAYGAYVTRAQNLRCVDYVHQVSAGLTMISQKNHSWPLSLLQNRGSNDGRLTPEAGTCLPRNKVMELTCTTIRNDDGTIRYALTGHDRFGVVTPWAMDVIKKGSSSTTMRSKVPSGGTIEDHQLHFAIDDDFDGITTVAHGHKGMRAEVRAAACVWCCGHDGKMGTKDDIRSWTAAQEIRQ